MDPLLAARLVVEMLDRVGDVHGVAVDRRAIESAVEDPPRRSDERMSFAILAVARLLADEKDARGGRPFSEHGLRAFTEELAVRAARRRTP